MTTRNPNGAASPLVADNSQAPGEELVDVAEVLAPASDHGPEMQDLAQTQADQVVDVESAEAAPNLAAKRDSISCDLTHGLDDCLLIHPLRTTAKPAI